MRRYSVPEPYEKLKELTRGRAVTKDSIKEFIEGLELPKEAKDYLLELTPHTYVGAAIELSKTLDNAIRLVNGVSTPKDNPLLLWVIPSLQ
jgi:adenylosuccinate lyase